MIEDCVDKLPCSKEIIGIMSCEDFCSKEFMDICISRQKQIELDRLHASTLLAVSLLKAGRENEFPEGKEVDFSVMIAWLEMEANTDPEIIKRCRDKFAKGISEGVRLRKESDARRAKRNG